LQSSSRRLRRFGTRSETISSVVARRSAGDRGFAPATRSLARLGRRRKNQPTIASVGAIDSTTSSVIKAVERASAAARAL
jgi:hypothetical protein